MDGIPKVLLLLANPPTVTTTGPELAPTGTGTVMLVLLQPETDAALTPFNVTMLPPSAPELGERSRPPSRWSQ